MKKRTIIVGGTRGRGRFGPTREGVVGLMRLPPDAARLTGRGPRGDLVSRPTSLGRGVTQGRA